MMLAEAPSPSCVEKHEQFQSIVYGARAHLGMPPVGGRLEPADIENIRGYLVKRAYTLKSNWRQRAANRTNHSP